ncbi:FAD-binding oxidoreductase [Thaumasiovibrio subtropicus]|uniref:FAD-binding oxidoreductase n=1 Tax=Thaumasiovibrio subtropicus TaxID=1891207 RepID=UPI00131C40CB|nr:FAD-binding oxidoreductase [Thaumasiovibrio subtropicus]
MATPIINHLSDIFSTSQIIQDHETLQEQGLALNGSIHPPVAIVFPESEQELVALVKAANQHQFEIHPVAQGRNWGYGTSQGTKANQVIVNLSRLNQTLEINEAHAFVRVQAGITQSELYQALQAANSNLQLDVTAAGLHTSVVGNILERGFGHTDYSDRFGNVLSMRVLLPNGDIINTGMGMFDESIAAHLYPYGIGPVVNGLFSQSNLGIVLEMAIAVQPKPEHQMTVMVLCKNDEDAPAMVSTIAKLKLDGVVTSGVHTVSMARALGDQAIKAPAAWVLTTSLAGPKGIVKARFKHFKKVISRSIPNSRVVMLNDFRWKILKKINTYLKNPMISSLQLIVDLKKGVPSDDAVKTLLDYRDAHSEMKTSEFPAYFRWICAISSPTPDSIAKMIATCKTVFEKYGYEERYSMTNITGRAVVLIANIRYGKTPEEIEKAAAFYQEVDDALLGAGYCPYRSGSNLFEPITPYINQANRQFLANLKQAMDPNNILSPDKYWLSQPQSATSSTEASHDSVDTEMV